MVGTLPTKLATKTYNTTDGMRVGYSLKIVTNGTLVRLREKQTSLSTAKSNFGEELWSDFVSISIWVWKIFTCV